MKRCDFVTMVLVILLACAAQARAQGGPAIDPAFIGDCHDVENGPKVFRDDHFGGGLIAPTGPFAGSSAEIGWGKTELIDSNPGWHRLKIDGTLMFDFMPGLVDRLNVFQRMGGATRGFVEIYIDQSLGSGPDSVQTFVGVSFDFRSAFGK